MQRLTGLDALRGIAALLVLVGHTSIIAGGTFGHLYLAVDFFFMLSGYVMARTYEQRLHGGQRLGFLLARIKRLWPLMALGTLLALPLANDPQTFIMGLLLIPALTGGLLFPLNGPAWSILFELFANLVHALGLDRLKIMYLLAICIACFVVLAQLSHLTGGIHFGQVASYWYLGIPRVLFSYILGIVLYRAWKDKPPLAVHPIITLILMPVLLLPPLDGWLIDIAFIAVLSPILIAGGLTMNGGRIGVIAGAASFPLYATHIPIRNLYIEAGMHWMTGVLLTLLVAFVIAGFPQLTQRVLAKVASIKHKAARREIS